MTSDTQPTTEAPICPHCGNLHDFHELCRLPKPVKATIIEGMDYRPTVQRINQLEPVMESLTDDELRAKTEELKARLKKEANEAHGD